MDLTGFLAVAGPLTSLAVIILGQRWQARKDAREDAEADRAGRRGSFELERDLRAEVAKVSQELVDVQRRLTAMQSALYAAVATWRAEAVLAMRDSSPALAALYRRAADDVEALLARDLTQRSPDAG